MVNGSTRSKLGLALAGGGFRASLFHLGVMRRMAELDLLRYVEVLSTVSGGSIVGALYALLLKRELEKAADGTLRREDYLRIVNELQQALEKGIRKNLRLLLFLNPLGILRVMLTEHSLGRRMARLYERYLYKDVVQEIEPRSFWQRLFLPGQIALSAIRIRPKTTPGGPDMKAGIEAYNREMVERNGSAVTKLVLNATALNSGARFWFSSTELGDWYLGHFRGDELKELLARKRLLQEARSSRERAGADFPRRTLALARWLQSEPSSVLEGWEGLAGVEGFPGGMREASFGLLRRAKLAAWYIRSGSAMQPPVWGGLSEAEHMQCFWDALGEMDADLATALRRPAETSEAFRDLLLDFVIELYLLRSAVIVASRIERHWAGLTLGEAVGASACFPPVFPPLVMLGFYDDLHVSRLGLTDGGVFDNVGITALVDEQCNYIIASDTGGLFDVQQRASSGRLGLSARVIEIVMNALARFQRHGLQERRRVSRAIEGEPNAGAALRELRAARQLDGLAFFHINSPQLSGAGLELDIDPRAVAKMRTDLDGFGEIETAALVNRGYDTADRYLRKHLAGTLYEKNAQAHWVAPERPPVDIGAHRTRAQRIVEVGRHRFFRALRLGAPVSWLFVIALVGAVAALTWNVPVSLRGIVEAASRQLVIAVESAFAWLPGGWTGSAVSLGKLVLWAAAIAALLLLIPERIVTAARWLAWLGKMARAYSGNLLWVLGGLPAVVAIVSSASAAISYVFFYLPFRAATRVRTGKKP
jgi:predicted acylesterase/phospholipase RssA